MYDKNQKMNAEIERQEQVTKKQQEMLDKKIIERQKLQERANAVIRAKKNRSQSKTDTESKSTLNQLEGQIKMLNVLISKDEKKYAGK